MTAFVSNWLTKAAEYAADNVIGDAGPAQMSDQTLYACFELDIAPPAYNFLNFLVLADIAREELGLARVHVVFVPGTGDGFRHEDIEYPVVNKEWRLRQICLAGLCLLPACRSHTLCASREEAADLLAARARHVFPFGYRVDKPRADHDYGRIVQAAAAGHRVDRLEAPEQARIYVREWLRGVAGDRPVVTITLRESSYDVHRSSNNGNWIALAREMRQRGYCPVVVRDTETVFAADSDAFAGIAMFPHAAVNLELRAALNAEAFLNTGINQGPWTLWHFLREIPYLCVYVIDRMFEGWHDYHIDRSGFTLGENMPFARGCQVTYWGDDRLPDLRREFWALVDRIEAGEHQRGPAGTVPDRCDGPLELAERYRENEHYDHALAIYRKLMDENPDDLQVQFRAAIVSFEAGEFAAAVDYLTQPLAVLGPEPTVVDVMARAKFRLGRLDETLALLDQALDLHPDDSGLLERRGDVLLEKCNISEARECFRRALERQPESPPLAKKLAEASFLSGRVDDAIGLYARLIRDHRVSVVVIEDLARALKRVGREKLAADCYEIGIAVRSGRKPAPELLKHVIAECLQGKDDSAAA